MIEQIDVLGSGLMSLNILGLKLRSLRSQLLDIKKAVEN